MSAESQLYAALSGHAGLGALVGTRIYPDAMPEGTAYPALVYTRIGTDPTYTIGGTLVCEDVSLQMQCWATTRESSNAVAAQVVAALAAAGERHAGQQSAIDPEDGLYAATVDVLMLIQAP